MGKTHRRNQPYKSKRSRVDGFSKSNKFKKWDDVPKKYKINRKIDTPMEDTTEQ